MPLLDRQIRGAEIGRIRIGTSRPGEKGRQPVKLDRLRFTSRSRQAIDAIAALYGGTARPWEDGAPTPGQWEVITTVAEIPVAVPPGEQVLTADYELWVKGVRKRLCDSRTERLVEQRPCLCSAEGRRSCAAYSRLHLILPDVPGGGTWGLYTKSENAADELAAVATLMQQYADRGSILPAVLRLELRMTVTDQGVKRYPVPVLQLTQSFRELAGMASGTVALPPAPANLAAIEAARPTVQVVDHSPAPTSDIRGDLIPGDVTPPVDVQEQAQPVPTPPGGWVAPKDATHLARMVEESPADLEWIDGIRDRARRAGWLDEWVDTRYSDAMARLREVLDWRAEEIKRGDARG